MISYRYTAMNYDPLLLTCIGVSHDLPLLPHFIAHYRQLGVAPGRFRVLLNSTDPQDPGLGRAHALLEEAGIAHVEEWIAPYTSGSMWEARRDLQIRHARADDWVLSADVDEFHEYPSPLPDFLAECDAMGVTAVQGVLIDRLAAGGRLAPVETTPFVLDQFFIQADATWSIAGRGEHHDIFGTMKLMAMHGDVLPSRGGHHPQQGQPVSYLYGVALGHFAELETSEGRFRVPTRVHHVHWTDTLPERLKRRLATPGVSPAGAEYGQKQLDHFAVDGGVALEQVPIRTHNGDDAGASSWQEEVDRLRRKSRSLKLRNIIRRIVGR